MTSINRKTPRYLLCFLITLILLSGCTAAKIQAIKLPKGKDLSIVVVSDLHYLDKGLFDLGPAFIRYVDSGDGRMFQYNNEIVDAFVDKMIETKPDILIISGDLTNNGELLSHVKLSEKLKKIEQAGTRVYIIPGNHDIRNAWARAFTGDTQIKTDTVSWTKFENLYSDFGYSEAVLRDKDSLSYLAMPSDDLWLLMLDTNNYSKTDQVWVPYSGGRLLPQTLEWIKTCTALAKKSGARILTVMHHNLLNHNELFSGYAIDNSADAQKLFHEENLELVLSGHLHIQDIRKDAFTEDPLYDIATGTLLMVPFQYGTLQYDPVTGFDYLTKKLDVEAWAKQNQLTDPNLLNFTTYATASFWNASYNKASKRLLALGTYTSADIDEMATTMADLNLYYFGGRSDLISERIRLSSGYSKWTYATEPEFTKDYIMLMARKSLRDNNQIHID